MAKDGTGVLNTRVRAALNNHCLAECIAPCQFSRCLSTDKGRCSRTTICSASNGNTVSTTFRSFCISKNFPRSLHCNVPQRCIRDICRGILLNSVITQGGIHGPRTVEILVGGITRAIRGRTSDAVLCNVLGNIKCGIDGSSIVGCLTVTRRTCLVFPIHGTITGFVRHRKGPGCCFASGKLLGLFLSGGRPILLRGRITITVLSECNSRLYCLGSPGGNVSISFCIPSRKLTIRIACSLSRDTGPHRINGLVGLTQISRGIHHLLVIAGRRSKSVRGSNLGVRIVPT